MAGQAEGQPTLATVIPRRRGWARLATPQALRRIVQAGFAAFILVTIVQHARAEASGGVSVSPEAYCPFGGLESLYKFVSSGGSFVSHTHLSNLVLFAAVLLVALLARSAFCGWICPLGSIQDAVSSLSALLQRKVRGLRLGVRWLKTRLSWLARVDRPLRLLKYGVLIWAVSGTAAYGFLVFRDYDPWAALLSVAEFSLTPGAIVLGVTLAASFFVERPWCRYACPLGAVSGLVGKLSPVYLKREEGACKTCAVCTQACPMGLPVHTASTIKSVDCIGCLECVGACPRRGALEVRAGLPLVGS